MANLNETAGWDDVRQIETVDRVVGGPGGTANVQAQQLANRTALLKSIICDRKNPRGEWVTGAVYSASGVGGARDTFTRAGVAYVVAQNHTSGVFADDLAAGRFFENDAAQLGVDFASIGSGKGLQKIADAEVPLTDYAAIRSFYGTQARVRVIDVLGGVSSFGVAGSFVHDSSDSTSADNGGTIIVGANGRRWKRVFDGGISVKWFGARGDYTGTPGSGTDDTASIQSAISASYYSAPQTGWRKATRKIIFPRGRYRVAQPNVLFQGLLAASYNISGDGKHGISEICYDVAAPLSTDFLIRNDNLLGFVNFEHIAFSAPATANQNLMYYASTGTAQNLSFENCFFNGWSNLFDVSGSANASENTFTNCRIVGFSGVAFRLNNTQAVNWRFFGTDVESFSGVLFDFVQGATVAFYQGSVIPVDSFARVLRVPSGAVASSFGPGNSPNIEWHGTRFEMRTGSLMAEKIQPAAGFWASWHGCCMGGYNIPTPSTNRMFKWAGSGRISISDSANLQNYLFDYSISGSSSHELRVFVKNSDIPSNFVTGSTFTLLDATYNMGVLPIFDISGCGSSVDGVYRPADSQKMSKTGFLPTVNPRGVSWSSLPSAVDYGASGSVRYLSIPPTRILEILFCPKTAPTYGSKNSTINISIVDSDNVLVQDIGSFTWLMSAPALAKMSIGAGQFVNSMAGHKLRFTFTSEYVGSLYFYGNLYLVY